MRTRALVLSSLASVATLGAGFASWAIPHQAQGSPQTHATAQAQGSAQTQATAQAQASAQAQVSTPSSSPSTSTGSATASATPQASTPSSPSPSTSAGLTDGSYLGQSVMTRYGAVQVTAVISGGVLTDVQATNVHATGGRLAAVPILQQEAIAAGSANIAIISGATFTSEGYIQSLQSALDQAK